MSVKKYAYSVIKEGIGRQLEFNQHFMDGLKECMRLLDVTKDFTSYLDCVNSLLGNMRAVDPKCADSLSEYLDSIIQEAEFANQGVWRVVS